LGLGVRVAEVLSHATSTPIYAVLLGTYVLYVDGSLSPSGIAAVAAFLGILPIAAIVIDTVRGRTDIFVSSRRLRPKYFTYAIASYIAGSTYFKYLGSLLEAGFILTYVVVTAAMLAASLRLKPSVHACGVAGPTTYLVLALGPHHALLYLLLIPTAYARLALKAHKPYEVALGVAIGVVFTAITYVGLELLDFYTP